MKARAIKQRPRTRTLVTAVAALGFATLTWMTPAAALSSGTTQLDHTSDCFDGIQAQFMMTPTTVTPCDAAACIDLGESVTQRWNVTFPAGCAIKLRINSVVVPLSGVRTLQPNADTTYILQANYGTTASSALATRTVKVTLPSTVSIDSSNAKALLLQALRTPNTTVIVQNGVDMDLTSWNGTALKEIPIETGVVLWGGRTSRDPGPRLYTTRRGMDFFVVPGDNVRITGLRIQGPEMGVGGGDDNLGRGIVVNSSFHQHVEIDHNELSGFSGKAIIVSNQGDPEGWRTPHNVRIHDNYIHHNQHEGGNGYGVDVSNGGYALIEHNVFDWNRHAIAGGDGSDGSGYIANENLVLQHGGLHRWLGGTWTHTHQFDMHGQESCGVLEAAADVADAINPFGDPLSDSQFNCGTAGESIYIRRNTFLYTEDEVIKLRGTPQLKPYGMFVEGNVFAHEHEDDAITQTESGLWKADNHFGVDGSAQLGSCDFDGDGVDDAFMATGATWWFSSGGQKPWTFLRASASRFAEVNLSDFDGDSLCDVAAEGTIFSGGKTPKMIWTPNATLTTTSSTPTTGTTTSTQPVRTSSISAVSSR